MRASSFNMSYIMLLCSSFLESLLVIISSSTSTCRARSSFSAFQGHSEQIDRHLEDVLALLAYKDPFASPMGHLMTTTQRETVADVTNAAMLDASTEGSSASTALGGSGGRGCKSVLELILVQLCRVQAEIRRRNDNKGEIFDLDQHVT